MEKSPVVIECKDVTKEFMVPEKPKPGWWNAVRGIMRRTWINKRVLHGINLQVRQGEFVGYVGPNGAGKSTTLKILTGVLTPTSGHVDVLGYSPTKDRYDYTYNIGVVFGHRSLLDFDIPVIESFKLYKDVYELSDAAFRSRLALFSRMLKIDELLHIPVRKLSLGQRMRCEIAASLLHNPKIVFLDEPTIGLDALAKEEIRKFLARINKEEKVTVILTTHDMADIEALCNRLVLIDDGRILHDGPLADFKQRFMSKRIVAFETDGVRDAAGLRAIIKQARKVEKTGRWTRLHLEEDTAVPDVVKSLFEVCDVHDLIVHEPTLESVIREVYRGRRE